MDIGFVVFCVAFGLFLMGVAIESLNGYDEEDEV